jgi:4-hydroxymandelate synthase
MDPRGARTFDGLLVDHIEFYVDDLMATTNWFVEGCGFEVCSASDDASEVHSIGLVKDRIRLVLSRPTRSDHPGAAYLDKHGDGVAEIALRVNDTAAAYDQAVRRGARSVSTPQRCGDLVTATIMGFGDVVHTFVQRPAGGDERVLPGLTPLRGRPAGPDTGLARIDHFAVCLEAGRLDPTVEFYERVLDFEMVFAERIAVGDQAIDTKAVQSGSGAVTFTLIEPDVSKSPGQIDDFLKAHGGPGVQHIALATEDIVRTVSSLGRRRVEFLTTPASYYDQLDERLEPDRHTVEELRRLDVLVDEDHDGQLFQIFTKSVHARNTLFLEVIERLGARTFGGGNIAALYRAVESQRLRDGVA